MTVAVVSVRKVAVDLCQGDTPDALCYSLPESEYRDTFYSQTADPLSVVRFPDTPDEYAMETCSRAVRENANFCERLGYRYQTIDRAEWEQDLFAIRSSAEERQGRRMPPAYLTYQRYGNDVPPFCQRHGYTVHGLIGPDDHLYGYCQIYRCGEMARLNTIIGHADRLDDRIMWLLMLRSFQHHVAVGARFGMYYTHDSGHGDGLRYWKERFGMRPTNVTWLL